MESADNREQPIFSNESEEKKNLPLSKMETLKLLNDSIDRLEQTIKGIDENSTTMPSFESIDTLVNATQKLADAVVPTPILNSVAEEKKNLVEVKPDPPVTPIADKTPTIKTQSELKTESKQPVTNKTRKKNNLALAVVGVTAIAVAIVTVFWLWLPQQENLSIAPEPTITQVLPESNLNNELSGEPTVSIGDDVNPDKITAIDSIADNKTTETTEESPATSTEIIIPPDLESPGRAKSLDLVAIKPELSFTPEQTLIAALETKITELTQEYPADLINLVKVNLAQNSLLVNVTDNWYELSSSRQNKLGNEILERSRKFGFAKLQFRDRAETLVARNPVVGDRIIILEAGK